MPGAPASTSRAAATRTLAAATTGDLEANDRIWALVYDELRSIAHRELSREQPGHTLSTTALVHEAYFKLVDHTQTARRDRAQFYGLACRAMRQILVDHARRRSAYKRNGRRRRVALDQAVAAVDPEAFDLVALDDALTRLSSVNERLARTVELRFFGGLVTSEIAQLLGVDVRTVERHWRRAKAYLYRFLELGTS